MADEEVMGSASPAPSDHKRKLDDFDSEPFEQPPVSADSNGKSRSVDDADGDAAPTVVSSEDPDAKRPRFDENPDSLDHRLQEFIHFERSRSSLLTRSNRKTRMRLRGHGTNPSRPRRAVRRVYENFNPIYEWRQEDDLHSIILYLPGFRKEFMKVTAEDPNILHVRGERLVAGNKWNWFQEAFEVPKTCKMSGIRAIFDAGILTIKMPKKVPDPATTTTSDLKEPITRPKQDIDSAKSNDGVTDQMPLDRAEENERLIDQKITMAKTGSDLKIKLDGYYKRVVKDRMGVLKFGAAVAAVVAVSVYVSYSIKFSRNQN